METRQPIFDSEFSTPKFPETKPDLVERILNMDEETFRRIFNIQKVEKVDKKVDLQGLGDQEIDEVD
jgi:hypothetical protein